MLIGALREGKAAGYVKSDVLDLYPQIVAGVFKYGYKPRTYNTTITGNFLLPWIVVNSQDPYSEDALAGDAYDYQTGTGVFMRYLLQAYKAEPSLLQNHKDAIIDSANKIIQSGFGTNAQPPGDCDPFTSYAVKNDPATVMTAYINRLSVLLLAIEISE